MEYVIVEREVIVHTFSVKAEDEYAAMKKYEDMKDRGVLDYSDGERVDGEAYIKGQPWCHN